MRSVREITAEEEKKQMNINFEVIVLDKKVYNGNNHFINWDEVVKFIETLQKQYGTWATIHLTIYPEK